MKLFKSAIYILLAFLILSVTTGFTFHVYCAGCEHEQHENACCSHSEAPEESIPEDHTACQMDKCCYDQYLSLKVPFLVTENDFDFQLPEFIVTSFLELFTSPLTDNHQHNDYYCCNSTVITSRQILNSHCVLLL